ncbi:hypothetical protein AB0E77_12190 [Streptomyces sp. NPDC032940]|uniref:hypothetical protein n=1 Tax=Streptomyces sp. NPDC032940 TaxID=3155366 RepID=UPI0033D25320
MGHVDPSHLVELALGHVSDEADVSALRHVASCPRCRGELLRTIRVVTAARGAEVSDLPVTPPERVWQRITLEALQEDDRLSPPREHPFRRSVAERGDGVGRRRSADTRTCEVLLALAPGVAVLLALWWRIRAGREPGRLRGRRLRIPWWRRIRPAPGPGPADRAARERAR